ncbi:MAG: hypothetical protein AB1779_05805 [Candidatus Thermoplasmatota archaeon]
MKKDNRATVPFSLVAVFILIALCTSFFSLNSVILKKHNSDIYNPMELKEILNEEKKFLASLTKETIIEVMNKELSSKSKFFKTAALLLNQRIASCYPKYIKEYVIDLVETNINLSSTKVITNTWDIFNKVEIYKLEEVNLALTGGVVLKIECKFGKVRGYISLATTIHTPHLYLLAKLDELRYDTNGEVKDNIPKPKFVQILSYLLRKGAEKTENIEFTKAFNLALLLEELILFQSIDCLAAKKFSSEYKVDILGMIKAGKKIDPADLLYGNGDGSIIIDMKKINEKIKVEHGGKLIIPNYSSNYIAYISSEEPWNRYYLWSSFASAELNISISSKTIDSFLYSYDGIKGSINVTFEDQFYILNPPYIAEEHIIVPDYEISEYING